MPKTKPMKKLPFGSLGRWLFAMLFVELVIIWAISAYSASYFTGTIATHYTLSGAPNAYGNGSVFWILGIAFSIAPLLILAMTYFRFNLINDYPYMIKMPAFYANLKGMTDRRRAYWINRYFEVILILGVCITAFFIFMALELFVAALTGFANQLYVTAFPLAAIVIVVVLTFGLLRNIYKQVEKEK